MITNRIIRAIINAVIFVIVSAILRSVSWPIPPISLLLALTCSILVTVARARPQRRSYGARHPGRPRRTLLTWRQYLIRLGALAVATGLLAITGGQVILAIQIASVTVVLAVVTRQLAPHLARSLPADLRLRLIRGFAACRQALHIPTNPR